MKGGYLAQGELPLPLNINYYDDEHQVPVFVQSEQVTSKVILAASAEPLFPKSSPSSLKSHSWGFSNL